MVTAVVINIIRLPDFLTSAMMKMSVAADRRELTTVDPYVSKHIALIINRADCPIMHVVEIEN